MKYTRENPDPNGFYPGWAEDGGQEQALLDRSVRNNYVRTPQQRERMAAAQRLRWQKIRDIRAARANKK